MKKTISKEDMDVGEKVEEESKKRRRRGTTACRMS